MFQHVAGVGFGVDDDQVGLQLRDALGQIGVGRQRGNDVVAGLQQSDAQRLAAPDLGGQRVVVLGAVMDDRVDDDNAQGSL
jgi:hypothetical protein